MNPDTTPTPRTDAHTWNKFAPSVILARQLERELAEKTNEVARLREELDRSKEMVMDAARRGDEMAAHWRDRAERAEAIIKQIHHYAGIIEGFQTKK